MRVKFNTRRILPCPCMDIFPVDTSVYRVEFDPRDLVSLIPVPHDRRQVCVANQTFSDRVKAMINVIKDAPASIQWRISSFSGFRVMFWPSSLADEILRADQVSRKLACYFVEKRTKQ